MYTCIHVYCIYVFMQFSYLFPASASKCINYILLWHHLSQMQNTSEKEKIISCSILLSRSCSYTKDHRTVCNWCLAVCLQCDQHCIGRQELMKFANYFLSWSLKREGRTQFPVLKGMIPCASCEYLSSASFSLQNVQDLCSKGLFGHEESKDSPASNSSCLMPVGNPVFSSGWVPDKSHHCKMGDI